MKRFMYAVVLMLVTAMPAFAVKHRPDTEKRSLVDDVIRMTQSSVGEDEIISFVRNSRDRYEISADDIIAMADAKVSKDVIKTVINEAADRKDVKRDARRTVYASPYIGWYDPFFSSYYYDPFFYGPRFGFGVSFGPRYYRGGGFRRGHR